jgi:capsular exopolysaccharide synthesis family protein
VVTITYRGNEPALVRDIPNVLATQFIERRLAAQQAETRSTAHFLRDQIEKLNGQLASAEEALRSFRERARIVNIGEQGRSEIGTFAQVQAQRNAVDAERASLAQTLATTERQAQADAGSGANSSPYRNLVAFPTLFRNQAAAQLLSSLAAAEERRSELLTRRTPQDPDVQQLSGRVREIEEQLRALTVSYLAGLQNEVGALDATLSTSRRELARFPEQEVQLARLERRAKGLEEISNLLQTRLKEAEIAQSAGDGSVRLMDAAPLPRRPSSPKPALNLALALVSGLALGLALAIGRDAMDRSVHSRSDLQKYTGATVLGFIPRLPPPGRRALKAGDARQEDGSVPPKGGDAERLEQAKWAAAAAFERLATNVAFARPDGAAKLLMLASPLPGEGKTTVSLNLAMTLARAGRRVLLVDADLRRARLHTLLGVARSPGLCDLLRTEVSASSACQQVAIGGAARLSVLSAGAPPSDPASLFALASARRVLTDLGDNFDVVVFDTSPINVVTDAALLASLVDAVILVARSGVTTPEDLSFAMEQLRHVGAPVIGTVLNDIDIARDATYDGAYRYYGSHTAYSTSGAV